ncbi:MAG: xylulokinase, partial [Actinobacteria bacterium]|nr:xylulokinase [Actinomycetota bacterium]
MDYLLGLCIGTSSTKALITNIEGKIIASSFLEYQIDSPFPGWTEQNPNLWLESSIKVIRNILNISKVNPKDIISLGISGQMHTTVFLDENNNVIRPAPLWNDQRTFNECNYLLNNIGLKKILELTSNKPITSFSLPKILWLRNNEINNFKRLRKFCLSKDYVKLGLSGKLSTDPSDASGTLCFDVQNYRWSEDLFNMLKLDLSILPEVRPSSEFSASLSKEASRKTGLQQGLPILTGTADTAGEMLGNGISKDGDCLLILGTGGVLLNYHSKYYENDGNLDMFCYPDGKYYSLGVTLSSSASLIWALNKIGLDFTQIERKVDRDIKYLDFKNYIEKDKFSILEKQVKEILPGANGLIFLPYLTGERAPYSDPDARGVLFGLNMNHGKRHILRAVMEGVTFSQRDCYEIVKNKGFDSKNIVISGGGAKSE